MKIKTLLLTFVFAFATTAFAETGTVYQTNFDDLPGSSALDPSDYAQLFSSVTLMYPVILNGNDTTKALQFGKSDKRGYFTSSVMGCTPNAPITFTLDVARYNDNVNENLRITIGDVSKEILNSEFPSIYTDSFTQGLSVTFEDGVPTDTFSFTIETFGSSQSRARILIDNLTITQEISSSEPDPDPEPDPVQLEAPANLAVANVTYESASASWTAIENATKYSVVLVAGETETTFETTETSITFENLTAETAYSVKVAAVGNGTTHLTSDYSTAFSFTTEAAPVGEWKVLFDEDFSKTIDVSSESGSTSLKVDNAPWVDWNLETPIYKAYAADGSIRISLKSDPGYVITTNLAFQALSTRITASVKGFANGSGVAENLVVTIGDTTPISIPLTGLVTNSYTTYVYETSVTAGTKSVKISVSGGEDLRTMIDSFKIEQFVSASLTELPAPTGVTATPATCYSANIAWTAVTGADGYTVTLQEVDADGNNIGEAIVKPVGFTETSLLVDGLKDGASYTVSIVALGDGVTGLDSPAATASFETAVDTFKPAFSVTDINGAPTNAFTAPLKDPIVINASAMVGEEAAEVAVEGAPEGATFVDGVFTWTPEGVEVGTVVTLNFTVTNEGGTYTTSVTITVAEALPLVIGGISVSDITATGATLSWDAVSKATSYTYDIWRGSSIITNGVDMETFFDFKTLSDGVIPVGFEIEGANGCLTDNGDIEFEHNIIKFDKVTGTLITKTYPKAVIALSIYIAKNKASTAEGATGNPVTIYASADDGATWVPVETYTIDQLPTKNTFTYNFDVALNYTRFKVEYNKVEMNLGISCVGVAYAGAGAKMFAQDQTTTDNSITIPKGLVADSEYFIRVKATNDAGSDNAYTYFRFKTEKATPGTVIILQ